MSDGGIIQKAELLFRKYGIQNLSAPAAQKAGVKDDGFKKDFLAEVQNAAMELALARRAETEQRITEINKLITAAAGANDTVLVTLLEQEKKTLEGTLPLD